MNAVARPHTLPAAPGLPAVRIEDASDDELRKCLADDQEWLSKFLSDSSRDTASERNQRVIQRTESRIAAVEEELDRRVRAAADATERERADARRQLAAFLDGVKGADDQIQDRARQVADAWAVIEPIAAALDVLMANYQSEQVCLPAQHDQLWQVVPRAADALGVEAPDVTPLPYVPKFADVRSAANVLRGVSAPSASPHRGTAHVERLIARLS